MHACTHPGPGSTSCAHCATASFFEAMSPIKPKLCLATVADMADNSDDDIGEDFHEATSAGLGDLNSKLKVRIALCDFARPHHVPSRTPRRT